MIIPVHHFTDGGIFCPCVYFPGTSAGGSQFQVKELSGGSPKDSALSVSWWITSPVRHVFARVLWFAGVVADLYVRWSHWAGSVGIRSESPRGGGDCPSGGLVSCWSLTPWNWVSLQVLTVAHMIKKLLAFCGTWMSITVFTVARYLTQSWAWWVYILTPLYQF
jgi:hypothetical protein